MRATPMLPPAPLTFSMMTGCPSEPRMCSPVSARIAPDRMSAGRYSSLLPHRELYAHVTACRSYVERCTLPRNYQNKSNGIHCNPPARSVLQCLFGEMQHCEAGPNRIEG